MDVGPAVSLLTDDDIFLFNEGSHFRLADKLGAHVIEVCDHARSYRARDDIGTDR